MEKQIGNFKFIETAIKDVYIIEQKNTEIIEGISWRPIRKKILRKPD